MKNYENLIRYLSGEANDEYPRHHPDGSICEAQSPETCPFSRDADKADAELTREAYEKARKDLGTQVKDGAKMRLGDMRRLDAMSSSAKNPELAEAIRNTGMNTLQFAKASGIGVSYLYGLMSGTMSPVMKMGNRAVWTPNAQKIASSLDRNPGDLFPAYKAKVQEPRDSQETSFSWDKVHQNIDMAEFRKKVDAALDSMHPSRKRILSAFFGLDDGIARTIKETAQKLGHHPTYVAMKLNESIPQLRRKLFEVKRDGTNDKEKLHSLLGEEHARQPARQIGIEHEETVDEAPAARYLNLCKKENANKES